MEKTLFERYLEFFKGLQLVRVSLENIHQGKLEHFYTLYAQLRGLYVVPHDKNRIPKNENVIAYDVAENLNIDTSLYISSKTYEDKENIYYDHLFTTQTSPTIENNIKVPLKDWMELDIVKINGQSFKIWEVIKIMADKNGGAHFDKKIEKENEAALCIARNKAGRLVVQVLMERVGTILFNIGLKVIKSQFDFHFIMALALKVPPKKMSNKNLLSFKTLLGNIPISVAIDQAKMLKLKLSDLEIGAYEFDLYSINKSRLVIINFSYEITEEMKVMLTIYTDDSLVKYKLERPLFIGHNFISYGNIEIGDEEIEWGFSALKIFARALNERQTMLEHHIMKNHENGNVGVLLGKQIVQVNSDMSLVFPNEINYMPFVDFINS